MTVATRTGHGEGRLGRCAGVLATLVLGAGGLTGCAADPVDPARAGTVVVSSDLPFASLNGATAEGRSAGSVLVRGLVQSGFTTLAPDGTVVVDESFGTVEKVADQPLTVRYTIAPTATWSDGVPVTPADLLLEWAARSGQLDEVVPELGPDGEPAPVPDGVVAFGAPSAVLARASAVPTVDGASVTVVYDVPVADWQLALDVNLPAHVVGRLALDPSAPAGASPSATPSAVAPGASAGASATASPSSPVASATPVASASPSAGANPSASPADAWAQAVVTAVQQQDREALVAISRVWRNAGRAGDVGADPTLTTTTGPYVLASIGSNGVEAVRNEAYRGADPAAFDVVRVRTDLDPLAQLDAVGDGDVDVAAPVSTVDVLAAAEKLEDVAVRTAGDAVLQVVVQESAGGVFDPATLTSAPDPVAAAAELRRTFLAAVPREDVVADAVRPVWARAQVSDVVAAQVATDAQVRPPADVPAAGAPRADGPLTVRVLTNTADPVRAAALELLTAAAADEGLQVVPVEADDTSQALRTRPEDWDAALVPVAQQDLPVAAFVARWRTGGATNVTGHADPALDAVLDALAAQPDGAQAQRAVTQASDALRASGAVLPVVRTPVLTVSAVRDGQDEGLPRIGDVPVLTPAAADLTWWWDWTRR